MAQQQTPPTRQRSEFNAQIIGAVIGAVALVVSAIITVGLPLLADPRTEPTAPIATPAALPPPTSPATAPTGAAEVSSSAAPVSTAVPAAPAGAYPCDATVSHWEAAQLSVVRDFPNQGALLRDPIDVGVAVHVVAISGTTPPWYRIASPEGRVLGWIPAEYLALAATCPQP